MEAHPGGDSADTVANSAIHETGIIPWLADEPIVEPQRRRGALSLLDSRVDPQFLLMTDSTGVLHTIELQVHARYGYDVRCGLACERASIELPRAPGLVGGEPLLVSAIW